MDEIGTDAQKKLFQDLIDAESDFAALAEQHGLDFDQIALWFADAANAGCLADLCDLGDMQTQVFISRFKLLVANRLVHIALDKSTKHGEAIRVGIELLKMDLKDPRLVEMIREAREPLVDPDLTNLAEAYRRLEMEDGDEKLA